MARRTPAVDALRERVKTRLKQEGHGSRVAFGKAIGMRPSSVTSFIAGESNPTIDKIDAIARYLRCSVPELFTAPATVVLDQESQTGVSSAPAVLPGDVDHALARLLRQSDAVEQDDALRDTIIQIAHQLIALVARPKKVRSAARKKARSR